MNTFRQLSVLLAIVLLVPSSPTAQSSNNFSATRLSPHELLGELAQVGFVINLSRRHDRFQDLVREGQRVGLDIMRTHNNKGSRLSDDHRLSGPNSIVLERWNAFDEIDLVDSKLLTEWKRNDRVPAPPGQIGCALSHFTALQEAKRRGLHSVMLLEDDIIFAAKNRIDFSLQLQDLVAQVADAGQEWEMLQLGSSRCHPEHRKHGVTRVVKRANECWLGHAILFREPGITKALKLWSTSKIPADTFYVMLQNEQLLESFVVVPPLINQRLGHSDLTANRGVWHVTPVTAPVLHLMEQSPLCDIHSSVMDLMRSGLHFLEKGITPRLAIEAFRDALSTPLISESTDQVVEKTTSANNLHQTETAACAHVFGAKCQRNDVHALVLLQMSVLLAESLKQLSLHQQEPTGSAATEAAEIFHAAIHRWEEVQREKHDRATTTTLCSPFVDVLGSSLVATAQIGLGVLLTCQARFEEGMAFFGLATWAAPAVSATADDNSRHHHHIAVRTQHGINVGTVAAVMLFLGQPGAKVFQQRASELIVGSSRRPADAGGGDAGGGDGDGDGDGDGVSFGVCASGKGGGEDSAAVIFVAAWSCANVGMLSMGKAQFDTERIVGILSRSVEMYDKLLHSMQINMATIPMAHAVLALADIVAIGRMDYAKALELANQAVNILHASSSSSNQLEASRLAAAALSKSKDRVKMFSKLTNVGGTLTSEEASARITYLSSSRLMMDGLLTGELIMYLK